MTITDQLRRQGIPFKTRDQELNVCCPFCVERGETPDTRFRLGVNLSSNLGHCFNCGWRSRHALQALARKFQVEGVTSSGPAVVEETPKIVSLPEDYHCLTTVRDDLDQLALDYLKQRMVSAQQIYKYQIGVSFMGRYAWRVVFPIYWRQQLRGFLARDFSDRQKARYLNESGMEKSIYGLPDKTKSLILFEGVFKALRASHVLSAPCCAVLGNRVSNTQVVQLRECGVDHVYYWPDPDGPGIRGARMSMMDIQRAGIRVSLVWPSVFADEAGLKEIKRAWSGRKEFNVIRSWELLLSGGIS